MTATRPPARPLGPVLARIALGLGLLAGGLALGGLGARVTPTPGLNAVQTPLNVPLDGAQALSVRLESDRAALTLAGSPEPGQAALSGSATHRERNPLSVQTRRTDGLLSAELRLNVRPLETGVIGAGLAPLQHRLDTRVSRAVPLTLTTETGGGPTRLDLQALRVRTLNARSGAGDMGATLPQRQSGPLTFVTLGGGVTLRAGPEWRSPALRVNTGGGAVTLDLGRAHAEVLNVGTRSGDVTGSLPRGSHQSVTTGSGDVTLTLPDGSAGRLDLRSEAGEVTLSLPPGVRTRVRFTDRTALKAPRGLTRRGNTAATSPDALQTPDLDVFLDAPSGTLTLRAPLPPEGDSR